MGRWSAIAVAALLLAGCGSDPDRVAPTTTAARPVERGPVAYDDYTSISYGSGDHWICSPELPTDPCRDLSTTVVAPDGSASRAASAADPGAPIDCFYVYPTASDDPTTNADFDVNASEIETVVAQAARYGTECRVFAPAYRQVTVAGVGKSLGGESPATGTGISGPDLAYADVLDAWKTYVSSMNRGRGVVIIGHSQGAAMLQGLIADEVDPSPELRKILVSAVLLGTSVQVPIGKSVGGTFQHIATCDDAAQTGCVLSFSSYPSTLPPAGGALFGLSSSAATEAVCVDPTDLAGGDDLADAVLPTHHALIGSLEGLPAVDTPFLSMPGALTAECATAGSFHYLAIGLTGAPDQRGPDRLLVERLGPTWGTHFVDGNLAQDDLIEVVRSQARAFTDT